MLPHTVRLLWWVIWSYIDLQEAHWSFTCKNMRGGRITDTLTTGGLLLLLLGGKEYLLLTGVFIVFFLEFEDVIICLSVVTEPKCYFFKMLFSFQTTQEIQTTLMLMVLISAHTRFYFQLREYISDLLLAWALSQNVFLYSGTAFNLNLTAINLPIIISINRLVCQTIRKQRKMPIKCLGLSHKYKNSKDGQFIIMQDKENRQFLTFETLKQSNYLFIYLFFCWKNNLPISRFIKKLQISFLSVD